jgi:hypothetical protein
MGDQRTGRTGHSLLIRYSSWTPAPCTCPSTGVHPGTRGRQRGSRASGPRASATADTVRPSSVRVLLAREQGLDTSQLGAFDETLLVEHPLPPLQEPGVSGTENGVNKHAKATDRIACPRVLPSEHQRDPRPPTPARRRGRGKRYREARTRDSSRGRERGHLPGCQRP